ncbi:ABC transporter substrate-binding protein [Sinorhizobium meliloti]|uniref:ABC transporter substrate-binding protein n=1 Tax=Rhizobium meliloti TaxID=382 RepID=UPI000FD1CB50|nr:sugar ABC transporter substrate-binding protein [Sinorhizobium meliloti]QGJ78809.1 sugar ABC transporter substrate-binding protein [Sinorhizobium meliloti]RVK61008.1 sugar ABC transporter substrate-binding protein [Sinorhizobium meliloti]RVL83369.1 sugar ABC transporter substrate-binding protein [Sinorhizobium meliloti]RVM78749.1 sugar ABC transporter substrate-binding protein [Sinorhizobium meliloti]RVM96746.1 sugar ABC transporter substrate-binding protein [Sinorhizobium meliloti]
MSDREKVFPTLTRRGLLKGGAAVAGGIVGLGGFPYINRFAVRAQEAPLKFWQFYAPGGPVASQVAWFEKTVADWNDSHPQKIELEFIPNSEYISGPKLATAFASGEGPDIFIISPGDFLRYYNGGVLKDLTPFIDDKAKADFPESVIANRMVDGKIFGIPMEVEPMAMYYSVKAFEEAGLNENDVPKTWEALLEVAKKLTTPERFGVMFETQPGYYQNFTWYPFLWQGGGEFQTADGKSSFDSPATVQALKFWQDAINSGVAPRQIMGAGGHDTIANLASGYVAMQNVGIWGISQLQSNAKDFQYGVFRLPTPPNGKYVTVGGGWAFVANANGHNSDAAGEFCAWALASMDQGSVNRVANWCTKGKSDMPPRNSALKSGGGAFSTGMIGKFAEEIHPGTRAEPRVPPEVYKIISDAIQQTQLGGADPQATATAASQQLDAFLTSYQGAPIL